MEENLSFVVYFAEKKYYLSSLKSFALLTKSEIYLWE